MILVNRLAAYNYVVAFYGGSYGNERGLLYLTYLNNGATPSTYVFLNVVQLISRKYISIPFLTQFSPLDMDIGQWTMDNIPATVQSDLIY